MKILLESHRKSDGVRVEVNTYTDTDDMLEDIAHQAEVDYYKLVRDWVHSGVMDEPLVLGNGPSHSDTYTKHEDNAAV